MTASPKHFRLSALLLGTLLVLLTGFEWADDGKDTKATTGGELAFTIRTVTAGGTYSPKHVLAIWIEHEGDFVKTRKAMANQRKQYLYTWKAASNYNVVDAITGATLTSHQTHTVTWDCTDLDGNIVPDGEYDVYTEFTDKHAQGPLYMLSFTKGPDGVVITPADETYFKDIELEFTPFVAEFTADITAICQWGTVTFTDASVNATSWEWDFGEGAAPATASTQGPHTVFYTTPGLKSVSLTINGNVTETKTGLVTVDPEPTAEFSYSSNALTVDFTNLSSGATTYLWDFGDGSTSSENNPSHTYATAGTYEVALTATYLDCDDQHTQVISVPIVGTTAYYKDLKFNIIPNPNHGTFRIVPGKVSAIEKIGIFAADGHRVAASVTHAENSPVISVDMPPAEKGVYILRLESKQEVITRKIMVH